MPSAGYIHDAETFHSVSAYAAETCEDVFPQSSFSSIGSTNLRRFKPSPYHSVHASSSFSASESQTLSSGESSREDRESYVRTRRGNGLYEVNSPAESAETAPSTDVAHSRNTDLDIACYKAILAEDVSPGTGLCPRSSVETYASTTASDEELDANSSLDSSAGYSYQEIPPLPLYRREIVDGNIRPSSPREFGRLFPSMNRLSIRHDEFTPDGNMNLRIDTVVSGPRRSTVQLFHMRMYDLARREFSLRRYCRDSGREVCSAKRQFTEPPADGRPILQRSVSSALKSLGGRRDSGGSLFSRRPSTAASSPRSDDGVDHFASAFGRSLDSSTKSLQYMKQAVRQRPTNTIKLEFSNYARVDLIRRGGPMGKRYEFEWWGHRYSWKRIAEKHLGIVAFHLLRDGDSANPVAHIVPETRSPNQIISDEFSGGWVPPCHMYISDSAVIEAVTDVADVIMATGLMALVDDCIKDRWETKKVHHIPVPLTSKTIDIEYVGPKAFMQHVLGRRQSSESHSGSPLRWTERVFDSHPINVY